MTDDSIRTELAELRETVVTGFAAMNEGFADMHAGFARMDHYFELQQAQHLELRGEVQELRTMLLALTVRVERLEEVVARLQAEVHALRDWTTREFADVRRELRALRRQADQDEVIRHRVAALEVRVTRLEQQRDEPRD